MIRQSVFRIGLIIVLATSMACSSENSESGNENPGPSNSGSNPGSGGVVAPLPTAEEPPTPAPTPEEKTDGGSKGGIGKIEDLLPTATPKPTGPTPTPTSTPIPDWVKNLDSSSGFIGRGRIVTGEFPMPNNLQEALQEQNLSEALIRTWMYVREHPGACEGDPGCEFLAELEIPKVAWVLSLASERVREGRRVAADVFLEPELEGFRITTAVYTDGAWLIEVQPKLGPIS